MREIKLRRRSRSACVAIVLAASAIGWALSPDPARAEADPIYTSPSDNVALGGYDPVAYFTDGKPIPGSPDHELAWRGATWRFASAEHREAFRDSPEAYAPQYGGYCAWAVAAKNQLYSGDPQYWRIVDGKLYVNYDQGVQTAWTKDIPGFIRQSEANWPGILQRN